MRGMLLGVVYGDVLGGPCEFGNPNRATKFDGKITDSWFISHRSRYGQFHSYERGQATDDSEMTISNMRNIAKGYTLDGAIQSYLHFVNSGTRSLGTNTRKLFHGYKTPKLFWDRYNKQFSSSDAIEASQSNGHLMRAPPLSLIADAQARQLAVKIDTMITNPSEVALEVSRIFVDILHDLIHLPDTSGKALIKQRVEKEMASMTDGGTVKQSLQDALEPDFPRDLKENRGWSLHSLSAALWAGIHATTFQEGIVRVIHKGGDSDTNASIAGAILGARFGEHQCLSESIVAANWSIIMDCKPSIRSGTKTSPEKVELRPEEYHPKQLQVLLLQVRAASQNPTKLQEDLTKLENVVKVKRARTARGLVIAITGSTASGKTTLAKAVKTYLAQHKKNIVCSVVSQDSYRLPGNIPLGDGKVSWEHESFTDWRKLVKTIKGEKLTCDVVLVEGYLLLANQQLMGLVERCVNVDSTIEQVVARRTTFPDGFANVEEYVKNALWPKHLELHIPATATNLSADSTVETRTSEICTLIVNALAGQ